MVFTLVLPQSMSFPVNVTVCLIFLYIIRYEIREGIRSLIARGASQKSRIISGAGVLPGVEPSRSGRVDSPY